MIKKTIFKKPIIIITENAWNKIISINKKVIVNNGFLFSAKTGGCNGFNYNFNMLKNDEFNEIHKGKLKPNYIEKYNIKVYIDPSSEFYLLGTKIDYVNEDIEKNIFENKFTFTPEKNKASTCGCGVSFSPKI
mgnify:CR=1 FL=1